MLSEEENRLLMQVGPGTPMGDLLRRYWMPIAAVAALDDSPTKPVRLFGEDLVLYRDKAGAYGPLDRHCPHRRADLSYGWVEDCGLRCNYHGWKYDEAGRCIDQPYEEMAHPEAHYKDRITIKAYPVAAKAGLLWAYPRPRPPPPRKTGCDEFESGFASRRVMGGGREQDDLGTGGRTCLWPNCLFTGEH